MRDLTDSHGKLFVDPSRIFRNATHNIIGMKFELSETLHVIGAFLFMLIVQADKKGNSDINFRSSSFFFHLHLQVNTCTHKKITHIQSLTLQYLMDLLYN